MLMEFPESGDSLHIEASLFSIQHSLLLHFTFINSTLVYLFTGVPQHLFVILSMLTYTEPSLPAERVRNFSHCAAYFQAPTVQGGV